MSKSTWIACVLELLILGAGCQPMNHPAGGDHGSVDMAGSNGDQSTTDLQPMGTIAVTVEVSGSGHVDSDLGAPSCAASCVFRLAPGSTLQLRATADADSFWGQWQGACAGQGPTCSLTVRSDQKAQVSFRRWTGQTSGVNTTLTGIWGRSASEVWAVGSGSTVLRYDGTRWLPAGLGVPLDRTLNGVHGDALALYTVGDQATLLRYDTDRWVGETVQGGLAATTRLRAVFSAGAGVAFAVGSSGIILRRSGDGIWRREPIVLGEELLAVWGSSATDVWAAGGQALLHLTASGWKAIDGPDFGAIYSSLAGSAPDSVWAGANLSRLYHFDGAVWQREGSFPSSGDPVLGIAALRGETFVLSGLVGDVYRRAAGGAWQPTPQPAKSVALRSLWGAPTGETWIVGERGTVLFASR